MSMNTRDWKYNFIRQRKEKGKRMRVREGERALPASKSRDTRRNDRNQVRHRYSPRGW
jgi:hypothetical protein